MIILPNCAGSPNSVRKTNMPNSAKRWSTLAALTVLMAVYVPNLDFALTLFRGDYIAAYARQLVMRWADGDMSKLTGRDWRIARADTESAILLVPDNPAYRDQLAFIHIARARTSRDVDLRKLFYREALKSTDEAIQLRPNHAWTWMMRVEALSGISEQSAEACEARKTANRLATYEMALGEMNRKYRLDQCN